MKHRRRNYLIKTSLQLKYMGIIVTTMLLVAFLVGAIIYHTSWNHIVNTQDLTIDKLAGIFDDVNAILVRWVIVFVVIIAILSVFISHKIAGPLYRLEQTSREIASGDLTARLRLRQGDELQDLQEVFNTMSESLCKMVAHDRRIIAQLVEASRDLRANIDINKFKPENIADIKSKLDCIIEDLRFVTSDFKLEEDCKEEAEAEAEAEAKAKAKAEGKTEAESKTEGEGRTEGKTQAQAQAQAQAQTQGHGEAQAKTQAESKKKSGEKENNPHESA